MWRRSKKEKRGRGEKKWRRKSERKKEKELCISSATLRETDIAATRRGFYQIN